MKCRDDKMMSWVIWVMCRDEGDEGDVNQPRKLCLQFSLENVR